MAEFDDDQFYWSYSYRVDRSDELKIRLPRLKLSHVVCSILWLIIVINQQMYILTSSHQLSNSNNHTLQCPTKEEPDNFIVMLFEVEYT